MTKTQRTELTFDGFGINGPDEYRTRIATFQDLSRNGAKTIEKYGNLFAAAPELLEALLLCEAILQSYVAMEGETFTLLNPPKQTLENVKRAIAKAKGQA